MIRALRLCFIFALLAVPAFAQTAATRATLYTEIDTLFADTGSDPITPAQLRQSLKNITASSYNGLTDGSVAATYQPLDATLTAIAGLTTASGKIIYATGADAFSQTDSTSFGRAFLNLSYATKARQYIGLDAADSGTLADFINFAAWGDSLTAGTGGTPYTTVMATATGWTAYNGGVGGETSTEIKTRLVADTTRQPYATIIWAGRNNYTDPTTVKADIATMVSTIGHNRYLVLGVINGDYGTYERTGGAGYVYITELNTDLAAIYGEHFIDIRAYLISLYDSGDAQDIQDHTDDIVPTSLRSDTIHLNSTGYAAVSTKIATKLHILQGGYGPALTPAGIKSTLGTSAASHGITNGAAIDALGAVSTSGVLARTGSSTYSARTIAGTSNQITVTNGDGVSGNPTISIPTGSLLFSNNTFYLQGTGNAYVVPGNGYVTGNAAGISIVAADSGDNVTLTAGATGTISTASTFASTNATEASSGVGSINTAGGIYATKKIISAGGFEGALTGNVTGDVSGSSGSTTGNAATATALATARTIGNVSFNGTAAIVPETIAVIDSTDSTSFPLMVDSATGSLQPKTDAGLTYNASTGLLTSTALTTGNAVLIGTSSGYTTDAEHPFNLVPVSTASVGAAVGIRLIPELVATANSDLLYGTVIRSILASAGYTGLTTYNVFVNGQSLEGGGTLATAYQLYIAAGPTATARWGVYQVGSSDQNYFAAPIDVGNADTTLARASAGTLSVEGVNLATETYAQTAAKATKLGSHASPDTTGGAITWATSAVYEVWTNTTTEYDLPAASGYDGKAVIFYVTGTNAITIDPNSSEVIVRDGTAQTGGVTLTLTGAAGNYVCLICDGTRWVTLGYKGTLAAGS